MRILIMGQLGNSKRQLAFMACDALVIVRCHGRFLGSCHLLGAYLSLYCCAVLLDVLGAKVDKKTYEAKILILISEFLQACHKLAKYGLP
ncbi:hypothetical protein NBRC116587_07110 [Pseudoteredinibacter isoporae]